MFSQYKGMKREVYVLFYGRIVTSMGAVIWPMMTLILSNKMHMEATAVATLLMVMGLAQLPFTFLGGMLADRFNKKYNIILCDLVTVCSYLICAFIPLGNISIWLFFIAGAFAALEYPSYEAMIADLTDPSERTKAYGLSYLGMNLGFVMAPMIGGFLFENYLNVAFMITSLATFSSTVLIFLFIKDLKKERTTESVYEEKTTERKLIQVLLQNPCIIVYIFFMGVMNLVYSQFNFLIPLNMEISFGVAGAKYFGMMTSVNAVVVIVATPILTKSYRYVSDTRKIQLGAALEVLGLSMFLFIQGILFMHFIAMIVFTIGEVLSTLGMGPYVSLRIPACYRGRVHATELVFKNAFQTFTQLGIAQLLESFGVLATWAVVIFIGVNAVIGLTVLVRMDHKYYPLLKNSG